ncbi:MAG: TPM domain-containing protein [Coriobacteriales bacterium]|nr:TPM domain-containing protein [Coriobacteriales bacterium]
MRLKRIALLCFASVALFALLLCPRVAFARSGSYVFDEYELLSQDDFSNLESMGSRYAKEYDVGVYLLITDQMGQWDPSSSERNEFARQYYLSHNLGLGSGKDGIIFVIAVDSRDYVTVKHFDDSTLDPFSNDSVDYMEEEVTDCLGDDEWYEGCETYYQIIGDHLAYFAKNGEQWEKPHILSSIIKAAVTLFTPLLVALGVVSGEKDAMKTARMQTEASSYMKADSFALSVSTDTFVNRTMSVVPIHSDDDDSDSGWSSMGGGFSGSGGGKF